MSRGKIPDPPPPPRISNVCPWRHCIFPKNYISFFSYLFSSKEFLRLFNKCKSQAAVNNLIEFFIQEDEEPEDEKEEIPAQL